MERPQGNAEPQDGTPLEATVEPYLLVIDVSGVDGRDVAQWRKPGRIRCSRAHDGRDGASAAEPEPGENAGDIEILLSPSSRPPGRVEVEGEPVIPGRRLEAVREQVSYGDRGSIRLTACGGKGGNGGRGGDGEAGGKGHDGSDATQWSAGGDGGPGGDGGQWRRWHERRRARRRWSASPARRAWRSTCSMLLGWQVDDLEVLAGSCGAPAGGGGGGGAAMGRAPRLQDDDFGSTRSTNSMSTGQPRTVAPPPASKSPRLRWSVRAGVESVTPHHGAAPVCRAPTCKIWTSVESGRA